MVAAPPVVNPIDQLINKYCVTVNSPLIKPGTGETPPQQNTRVLMGNHRTQALIDGIAFFSAIEQEIATLLANPTPGRFFYIAGWWLTLINAKGTLRVDDSWDFQIESDAFTLPISKQPLLLRLVDMATQGVNVRVMGWVTPFLTNERVGVQVGDINFPTLMSVDSLRKLLPSPEQAILNTLAHPLGGLHTKLMICGDQNSMRAYTSGFDTVPDRYEVPGATGGWHDIGVKVEGIAAGAIHDFYRSLWNEQLQRPADTFKIDGRNIVSHNPGWKPLIARAAVALSPNTGRQYVQVLRTLPQMNFEVPTVKGQAQVYTRRGLLLVPNLPLPDDLLAEKFRTSPRLRQLTLKVLDKVLTKYQDEIHFGIGTFAERRGFSKPRLSFAPNGIFEFKVALRKAISSAEKYIFIADQSLSAFEVMDWIGDRMLRQPNLKVIFMYGADPMDPPSSFLSEAMNNHLDLGLPRGGDGQPLNLMFRQWDNNVVHCKVSLIDDTWCAIGSANCMRRSLYTDIELSVGILEPPTPDAQLPATRIEEENPTAHRKTAPSFVQQFRRDLWAHYCGLPIDPRRRSRTEATKCNALLPLDRSLAIWNPAWGRTVPGVVLRKEVSKKRFSPFPSDPKLPFEELQYERQDADSRKTF